jgi:hypothetical protein
MLRLAGRRAALAPNVSEDAFARRRRASSGSPSDEKEGIFRFPNPYNRQQPLVGIAQAVPS